MRLSPPERDEVIAVTGDQKATLGMSECEDERVCGLWRQYIAQAQEFVTEFLEEVGQILRYIMVEQELHGCSCAICRATNRSTCPRWSS